MSAQPALVLEPPPRRTRPQLTVAPPAPVPVPRTPFVVLVLLVVAVGVLGILLLNTKIQEDAFTLHALREEQLALDQRQQELEQQLAVANSPVQLSAAARELGMVRVPLSDLGQVRLPDGEVVREPSPVTGEPERSGPARDTAPAAED